MTTKIESEKLLISDVFQKWYRIPNYQRPYVWGEEQIEELLNDIMQASDSNPNSEYFLGSMVLQKTEKTDRKGAKYIEYDLLDGQQRLTTLFLTMAVLRDLTVSDDIRTTCRDNIFQKANQFKGIPERLRIVFDIRDDVKRFIDEFVLEEKGTTKEYELKQKTLTEKEDKSIKNISQAILTIQKYFSKNNTIERFFQYLQMNVLMVSVSATELEDAFMLFTVMNNRGMKLRNSDILKADNLKEIDDPKIQSEWAKEWEEIEGYFEEGFDNFLSLLRTILVKQKANATLLKEFEDNIYNLKNSKKPLLKKGEETFEFIRRYKEYYEKLFDNFHLTKDFELCNYLTLMQKGFEGDSWIAPLLKYYDKFKDENLIDFVKALGNKFANDWLVGLSPTKRLENMNSIIKAIETETSNNLLSHDSLKLDNKDLLEVLEGNIYGKRGARYIMLKLDLLYAGHAQRFIIPDTISIEHILPRTPKDNSQWKIDFTDVEREEWTNKLGNLVLISRKKNSSQGNKDYADKQKNYFKKNIDMFANSLRVLKNYPTWTLLDLKKNHQEVSSIIKGSFGL